MKSFAVSTLLTTALASVANAAAAAAPVITADLVRRADPVTYNQGAFTVHTATDNFGFVYTFSYYTAYTDTYTINNGGTLVLISQEPWELTWDVVYPTATENPTDATTTSTSEAEGTTSESGPTLVEPLPESASNVASLVGLNSTTISSFTTMTEPCDTGCEKPTGSAEGASPTVSAILSAGASVTGVTAMNFVLFLVSMFAISF